ncbi:MAG: aromatic ring-hydroxylating dioxygenase subunit alpha [Alphaproteobacteria bacterium]|nr:aromatic ring-hydroxylating dioxygenase subunit alpha [Alphaproteobacteria bacterium]
MTDLLRNLWYLALPAKAVRRGETFAKVLLGEPILFGRDQAGAVFALRDICPHRGIPLSDGRFDGCEVACCYHGWRFDTEGRCTAIPALAEGQKLNLARIKVHRYPCREVQGNLWVYIGDKEKPEDSLPEVPQVPVIDEALPKVQISMEFACNVDHAVVGLMDPSHAPYVHTSWWWKSKKRRELRLKEKHYEPAPMGFRMTRHPNPEGGQVYRLLGKNVTTEITYTLPGVRVEHVQGDRYAALSLTAVTPLTDTETEVHQCLYWTMPWLAPLTPVVRKLAKTFLGQDFDVVMRQQRGLRFNPSLMLIDDADTQAKWYYKLKREYLACAAEGRAFVNPIEARTLRWRS